MYVVVGARVVVCKQVWLGIQLDLSLGKTFTQTPSRNYGITSNHLTTRSHFKTIVFMEEVRTLYEGIGA